MNFFTRQSDTDNQQFSNRPTASWTAAVNHSQKMTYVVIALVIINLALTFRVITQDRITIITPPNFDKAFELNGNKADMNWKKMWSVMIAELLGNANNRSVDVTLETLKPMMNSADYERMADQLQAHVKALSIRNQEQRFEVLDTYYDAKTDKVIIYGERELTDKRRISDKNAELRPIRWTYEVKVKNANGSPELTYINQYEGTPQIDRTRLAKD
ncbi:type IV conjugative transfer system protein TraE (plasmid) [Vibrio sp. SS-MA-C1-2]|uniref:type IV conjugative transfer system protein TraE n=1 Tax=Vibrio sp. SS-MA-C1-2 TaxID=2908646 RepID=UPI001F248B77|nr:type IV conjugative transfer system protein TraE [Vibrio sp. SS-MA-C1-2]UJF20354.1 type IV conjugative transfer system protein TraE [Vibrio sp. SS-MA-C1-2]